MRTIALAALVVALATPAWATNEEEYFAYTQKMSTWDRAVRVCIEVGGNADMCKMRTAPEERLALVWAENALKNCKVIATDATPVEAKRQCAETRAYIKQRWGY